MYSKAPYSYSFMNIGYSEVKHQMGFFKSADLEGVPKVRHPL